MKLFDLASITTGLNQKRHPQGAVFFLQARDFVESDRLDPDLKPSILDYPKLQSHYLQKGDVLVLAKGHHGFNAFMYNEDQAPAVASSIFLVLKEMDSRVWPKYLVWYINLESTQQQLMNSGRGSALPSINKKILGELEVSVPEMQMQRDVVAISELKERESEIMEQLDLLKRRVLEINLKERIQ